ncbi:MAG: hypothetical protein ACLP50_08535 [Solirubrobacteraceae bacterium]
MRPAPGEWDDLRLAAKAADRGRAAKALWPAFEKRLKELGYGPRGIAHAFATLTGLGGVTEALAELERYQRLERTKPVPFEIVEHESGLPVGYLLAITRVDRDDHCIRIRYTVSPALSPGLGRPRCEAQDDRSHEYSDLGGAIGLAEPQDRSTGVLVVPRPQQHASLLRVRMSWSKPSTSLWEGPAYELRLTL